MKTIRVYQEWLIAFGLQAITQGKFLSPLIGLQGAQLYLIFLRWSSFTTAMSPPSMSNSFGMISRTL